MEYDRHVTGCFEMSKRIGKIGSVKAQRARKLRHYQRRHGLKCETDARVFALEWEANGIVWQIDLDAALHLTGEFDRDHYGEFVMPFETELNIDDFVRGPNWDPFIGSPRHFNGPAL